tara:strand:+ start:138 stop:500 length:363 start_codon:yes stop_codon:yes gene_type:complete
MEFEKLKKKNFLSCQSCNSNRIEKTLMAPKLINHSNEIINVEKNHKLNKINKKMKEYKTFIKNNFKYVGKKFAYEARSIHYDSKKKDKGIFGIASKEEIKELTEEGIDTGIIPWADDKNN